MESNKKTSIAVEVTLNAPIDKVWNLWTNPEHITKWNFASDDWHSPKVVNDLRVGGRFVSRMEAKDGSFGFDFSGVYTQVKLNEQIAYTLDDDRKVDIVFYNQGNNTTKLVETFEAETENSVDLQQFGWQCILNNFKKHVETFI